MGGEDDHLLEADRVADLLSGSRAQVIDVRPEARRGEGFIPGSRHVPAGELSAQATTLDRERTLVLCGDDADEVRGLTEAFRAAGFTAYALEGGVEAWRRAGHPVELPES